MQINFLDDAIEYHHYELSGLGDAFLSGHLGTLLKIVPKIG
jgi:hypothetical protein